MSGTGTSKEGVRRERLEIPSKEAFDRRFLVGGAGMPASKPNITAPEPPSALLSRLQAFLPAIQTANQQLQQAPAEAVQIDHASDEEGPYVELDLACGLFDLKDQASVAAAERSLINTGVSVERFGEGSSSSPSDEDDTDESDDEPVAAPMETEGGAGAATGEQPAGAAGAGSQEQKQGGEGQQPGAAAVVGRRRVRAKHKKRRAGIEVIG